MEVEIGTTYKTSKNRISKGFTRIVSQDDRTVVNKGNKPIGGSPPPAIRENGYPFERFFTLSEYLSSPSGVVEGRSFNRREVIKYIANVKGGVHLSAQQRKQEEKLIARLGKIEKKIMVHNTDGLLVEAVAIAQALGTSDDAKKFINKVGGGSMFNPSAKQDELPRASYFRR